MGSTNSGRRAVRREAGGGEGGLARRASRNTAKGRVSPSTPLLQPEERRRRRRSRCAASGSPRSPRARPRGTARPPARASARRGAAGGRRARRRRRGRRRAARSEVGRPGSAPARRRPGAHARARQASLLPYTVTSCPASTSGPVSWPWPPPTSRRARAARRAAGRGWPRACTSRNQRPPRPRSGGRRPPTRSRRRRPPSRRGRVSRPGRAGRRGTATRSLSVRMPTSLPSRSTGSAPNFVVWRVCAASSSGVVLGHGHRVLDHDARDRRLLHHARELLLGVGQRGGLGALQVALGEEADQRVRHHDGDAADAASCASPPPPA